MRILFLLIVIVFLVTDTVDSQQVPFNTTPSWISTSYGDYSTGAGWADINKDGWIDLVVSNGNDMSRQKVAVFLNNNGTLPQSPSWESSDIDYLGHLTIGDVNMDGWPDVAVSVFLGAAGFSQRGRVKLYLNNNGTLSSTPSWISADSMYTFSCAFGDADNDGDLDLAVASGEGYNSKFEQSRIYYNNNGTLSTLPGWKSAVTCCSMDIGWGDFNNDGRLDIALVNERGPNRMFLNYGDSIGTIPAWTSTDASQYANSLFIGDIDNDGFRDLAVSDNNQIGGTGKFKIYKNNNGTLSTTPFWTSAFSGYGSGITLADVDFDNDLDLITGGWWKPCWIYLNQNGNFTSTPQWTSSTNSVVEAIVFEDCNNNGLDTISTQFTGNGSKKLYYIPREPVHRIMYVKVGNDTVQPNLYCFDLENGWVSLKNAPSLGTNIIIRSIVSHSLDFAVSNWDPTIGNYVFNNTFVLGITENTHGVPKYYSLSQNYPNPFNPVTTIEFGLPEFNSSLGRSSTVSLKVYDVLGREVSTLINEPLHPGNYKVIFEGTNYPSGVYFYKLITNDFIQTKKMILIK